jgi:hypothetical protein
MRLSPLDSVEVWWAGIEFFRNKLAFTKKERLSAMAESFLSTTSILADGA